MTRNSTVDRQEIFVNGVEDLLAPGSSFLKLWTSPWSGATAMQTGYNEMDLLLSRLETAYDFIQDEGDDQSDDIISQMLIAELDAAIAEIGADLPEWIGTWETIPDVIAWVEDIMSGPYTIPVEVDDTEIYDLTVDLSALFLTPVPDWKTKLPYHEFLPRSEWATFVEDYTYGPYALRPRMHLHLHHRRRRCALHQHRLHAVRGLALGDRARRWSSSTAPAAPRSSEDEFPYFPDYTFGGLFPGLNRSGWLTLIGDVPGS